MNDPFDLVRFVEAQDITYSGVVEELEKYFDGVPDPLTTQALASNT